jgi:thymidylate synthase
VIVDEDVLSVYSTKDGNVSHLFTDKVLTQEEFINKIKTDDEFAKKWGDLGPVYGQMWRDWDTDTGEKIDQIANLINDLKTNPDGRRLMVSAWNPTYIPHCVLPPCHYGFQVYTRELSKEERIQIYVNQYMGGVGKPSGFEDAKLTTRNIPTRAISLMWNQRSVDTFLGLPFNIASYGLLLTMIADEVNMVPEELIGNLGDTHLYLNHIEQAKEQIGRELSLEERKQIFEEKGYVCDVWPFNGDWSGEYDGFGIPKRTREPYPLPTVHVRDGIYCSSTNDVILENYQSHPTIKAPLSN